MGKTELDFNKLSSRVKVYDDKRLRLAYIKAVRKYSKSFKLNQFDTSIEFIIHFKQIIAILMNFLKDKNMLKAFDDYALKLSPQFNILFKNFYDLTQTAEKDLVQYFGT